MIKKLISTDDTLFEIDRTQDSIELRASSIDRQWSEKALSKPLVNIEDTGDDILVNISYVDMKMSHSEAHHLFLALRELYIDEEIRTFVGEQC